MKVCFKKVLVERVFCSLNKFRAHQISQSSNTIEWASGFRFQWTFEVRIESLCKVRPPFRCLKSRVLTVSVLKCTKNHQLGQFKKHLPDFRDFEVQSLKPLPHILTETLCSETLFLNPKPSRTVRFCEGLSWIKLHLMSRTDAISAVGGINLPDQLTLSGGPLQAQLSAKRQLLQKETIFESGRSKSIST